MIKVEKVKKYYGSSENSIRAMDDVSLNIDKGEFIVITGPSGSGKTTFLNLIGCLTSPDEGKIIVDNKDIHKMSDRLLSQFRSNHFGFIFQYNSLIPTLSAMENVQLPLMFSSKRNLKDISKLLLEKVGLKDRIHAYAHELSEGQKRRVSIARALVNNPDFLICDEPTGDLDPETESTIMTMIKNEHKKGTTVILTTHNHHLKELGDKNFSIINGKISHSQ